MNESSHSALSGVRTWLWIIYSMILAMVMIGGTTRLTGSGLSMVEWKPLFGILPPIGEAQWLDTFEKYKQFPQYIQHNSWMQLEDFKQIFFWEYVHRLFGRLIGLVFVLPFVYFVLTGKLHGKQRIRVAIAFVLGGLQGLLGWYMVKSGLVDVPSVSHLRLAAHLLLAFAVALYVLWVILSLDDNSDQQYQFSSVPVAVRVLLILVLVQVFYGALAAGTRSGYLFATFPTFGGIWFPEGLWVEGGLTRNLLHNPYTIQFVHRYLGSIIVLVMALIWFSRRNHGGTRHSNLYTVVFLMTCAQVTLGIATIVSGMKIPIAVIHQGLGLVLLSALLVLVFQTCRVTR